MQKITFERELNTELEHCLGTWTAITRKTIAKKSEISMSQFVLNDEEDNNNWFVNRLRQETESDT